MLLRHPLVALAALVVLVGCGADGGSEPTASPAPTASGDPASPQEAERAFRAARRSLAAEPVTGFDATLRLANQP